MVATDEIINGPPPGLFFAGSDEEEEEDVIMQSAGDEVVSNPAALRHMESESPSLPQTPQKSSSPPLSPLPKLFLDDDDEAMSVESGPSVPTKRQAVVMEDSDSDIEVIYTSRDSRGLNNDTTLESLPLSPITEQKPLSPAPMAKKRRVSSPQRISTELSADNSMVAYLGEVVVPNAWSNVSGTGYITTNESVVVHRERQGTQPKPSTSTNGKKKTDGKKQVTLTSMLKSQPPKVNKKKKTDNIVRLVNNKGFGMLTDDCCRSC
jgi:DNA repair protein RAD5